MRDKDVKIGHLYMAKVSGKDAPVRIQALCLTAPYQGWKAVNVKTGREVYIRSGRRLKYEVDKEGKPVDMAAYTKALHSALGVSTKSDATRAAEEQRLVELFRQAGLAALKASDDEEDGGTCNMDSPAFRIDRMLTSTIKRLAKTANLSACEFTWMGKRWFWLNVPLYGQGNRRARMAKAAADVLEAANGQIEGFHGTCYYQMD